MTMPLKGAGDVIYVIGETKDELGAYAYYRLLAEEQDAPTNYGGTVPSVDAEQALKIYAAMNKATDAGLLKSATTPTKGGLAVALSLACIGGQLGAEVNLSDLGLDATAALFSESNSRFVVSAAPEKTADLEALFAGLPMVRVGSVVEEKKLSIDGAVNISLEDLVQPFKATLHNI